MTGKEEFWMILGPFLANQGQRKKKKKTIKIKKFELLNIEKNWEKYFEEKVK